HEACLGAIGDYEIQAVVARGGQGVVYKARQPGTERSVAIKRLLLPSAEFDARARRRFQREVEVVASLRHPNIVTMHSVIDDGRSIVMEWVEGSEIDRWADSVRGQRGDEARIIEVFRRVATAIAYAHGRAVLHRDIKPSNILVTSEDEAKILDFGLARDLDNAVTLTQLGQFSGTPTHASPEHIDHGLHEVDVRSDVYALGTVLYRCLTGRLPFEGKTLARLFDDIREGRPSNAALSSTVPRDLAAIVQKAMHRDRDKRYATMTDLAGDLERYQRREPTTARHATAVEHASAFVRRHKSLASMLSIAGVLLLALAVQEWRAGREIERERNALRDRVAERDAALHKAEQRGAQHEVEMLKAMG
ncbi:MAG TPA: serine/threonine-protein kinase, partial [Planctomycetota bacterium]|nr:serine/threonine-protein kinase [Planctomycetota bacterium]